LGDTDNGKEPEFCSCPPALVLLKHLMELMLESLQTNSTISHYRILQKLGAGGMGEIASAIICRIYFRTATRIE
jgi:hypothetical protein